MTTFPRRKVPAAFAWLTLGLCRRALAALRGRLTEIDVPSESDFQSQYGEYREGIR